MRKIFFVVCRIWFLGFAISAPAALIRQWDFNGTLAASTAGQALVPGFAAPATAAGVSFTTATINAQLAQIASFTRGTFFRVLHDLPPNGGAYVNNYTLVMDVMFPSRPVGYAVLWQTNPSNANDGDWFINPSAGVGISGVYGGNVPDGTWNRLALVIDATAGTFTSFINGTQVQQTGGVALDGRWSLDPSAFLFADETQENAGGLVNSVQLRDEALAAADIAALGGPSAAGVPLPALPTVQVITPNGGEILGAGSTQNVAWVTLNPSGLVQLDLYHGTTFFRTLTQMPLRQSNYVWVVHPRLGDAADYRLKLTAINFPGVEDFSDGPFTVTGSGPPSNPLFGQALQINGGFEDSLLNWQTVSGHPITLASGSKGAPHSGARFFHGGQNQPGNAVLRQEIDLIAAGFTPQDIDAGATLNAQAWLRNWFGAGTFDDQVYYRVAYLNAAGEELASVRCMVAGNDTWLVRPLTGLVPPGTRRLAVEIVGRHRRDLDNDSMADDLVVKLDELLGTVAPQITKLPMLQDVRTNAMTLLWETDGNLASPAVDWGRSNVAERTTSRIETLQIDSTHYVHRATLTDLAIETPYVYRVRNGATMTSTYSFRTAPDRDTAFAVAWWGDNHAGTVTLKKHVANMLAHEPDFIAVAGDMINSGNILAEWHDYWFKPLEHLNLAQTRPVIFARGNHDGEHALAYAYSVLPGNESWFAFDYGRCRFIFLDSEVNTAGSPEQFTWLQNELARPETQRAAFRIVCFHRPPFVNLWNGGGYTGETFVRNDWVPLFEQQNVDLVISGHAHNYNRGASNGVTYVVSGGGGGTLDVERVAHWPLYTIEYSRYHYDLMEVTGDLLSWQVFDDSNQLIDLFTLQSRRGELRWQNPGPNRTSLSFLLMGKPGVSYVVEASTNLNNWAPFATNALPTGGSGLTTNAISANGAQRFFRARVQ